MDRAAKYFSRREAVKCYGRRSDPEDSGRPADRTGRRNARYRGFIAGNERVRVRFRLDRQNGNRWRRRSTTRCREIRRTGDPNSVRAPAGRTLLAGIILVSMARRHVLGARGISGREVARVHGAPRRALQLAEDQSHREQKRNLSRSHHADSISRIYLTE